MGLEEEWVCALRAALCHLVDHRPVSQPRSDQPVYTRGLDAGGRERSSCSADLPSTQAVGLDRRERQADRGVHRHPAGIFG